MRPLPTLSISILCLIFINCHASFAGDDYRLARHHMVELIRDDVLETSSYIDKTQLNPKVMKAMAEVPRHEFVPRQQKPYAYANRPLPIGHGQTISQPYIVALMSDLLHLTPESRVLEVGTGSGYQAAILAKLAAEVYTVEIIKPLAQKASKLLQRLHFKTIHTRTADGYYGWPEHGPFDAIIVTAAASHVPPPLLDQLKVGGRMVIPVGSRFQVQQLLLITKEENNSIQAKQILPVRFVPLTGKR